MPDESEAAGFDGLEVVAPGALSLIQDNGRVGFASIGVGRSGAADRGAFRQGAAMVGNDGNCAAIEVLLGGLRLRAHGEQLMALTGAGVPVTVDGTRIDTSRPFAVADGAMVALGTARTGLRGYLSVRGGVGVRPVLGSRSTDTLAGLGPAKLATGDRLPVPARRTPTGRAGVVAEHLETTVAATDPAGIELQVMRGPRFDWFAEPELLVRTEWIMSPRSDRVGLRLTGGFLRRSAAGLGELPSEGMVLGCLQVPPSGEPVLLMPDHPVTGGYPVIGVVTEASMDRAAQARPGQSIRFRWSA